MKCGEEVISPVEKDMGNFRLELVLLVHFGSILTYTDLCGLFCCVFFRNPPLKLRCLLAESAAS